MAISILSPVSDIYRRDLSVDTHNLVDPTHGDCLVAGEWVVLDASGDATISSPARASNIAHRAFQVFTEKGDYSAQALDKVTILNSFDYIAETDQYDPASSISAGSYLTINSAGVLISTTTTGHVAVAVALSAPVGGVVKYQRISPLQLN